MTENQTPSGWIVFDQVEIDLAGRRVFVAGVETSLEPKAFAVLCLFARNPGQAFTRDKILDAVWGHRHVTPGVLNRVVTLLRQALGESAEATQYLHTLHGVGYRFDAAPQQLASRRAAATTQRDEATRGEMDRAPPAPAQLASTSASVIADAPPAADTPASRASVTATHAEAMVSPTASWRGRIWLGALFACVLVGAGYLLTQRSAKAPTIAAPTLVVLPLRPVGSAADERVLADGLSEELITRLARIDGLRLISRTSAALAQTESLDLNQLAARLHVSHALEGSLRQSAQQLRIDLRLIEVPGGRTLWAQDYDRAPADVFALQSEIARSVAAALTLKLGLAASGAGEDVPAFRRYLGLRHELLTHPELTQYDRLTAQLREFSASTPGYARAHGLLARTLIKDLRPANISAADSAEAEREAARALELDPDQIDAHVAVATLACRATEWQRCMDEYQRLLELAPADANLRTSYAHKLAGIGYLDHALEQIDIAATSDPLSYEANLFHARLLDTVGRHEEARAGFEAMIRSGGSAVAARLVYARWFNALFRGDLAVARALATTMPEAEHFRDASLAVSDALADPQRWPQALPAIEASERASGHCNFARLFGPNPDSPALIAAFETVLRNASSSYNLLLWNPEYAALRRDPAFQDSLRRTHIIDYWRSNGWPAQCHAEGERAICN